MAAVGQREGTKPRGDALPKAGKLCHRRAMQPRLSTEAAVHCRTRATDGGDAVLRISKNASRVNDTPANARNNRTCSFAGQAADASHGSARELPRCTSNAHPVQKLPRGSRTEVEHLQLPHRPLVAQPRRRLEGRGQGRGEQVDRFLQAVDEERNGGEIDFTMLRTSPGQVGKALRTQIFDSRKRRGRDSLNERHVCHGHDRERPRDVG
mmetsp:Transcript_157532/g.505227  ORF Transcript_157532/g.505227 Transcript_157532/m.505227 type:complete len:209 (-) Transcript_157532:2314-2940(-)